MNLNILNKQIPYSGVDYSFLCGERFIGWNLCYEKKEHDEISFLEIDGKEIPVKLDKYKIWAYFNLPSFPEWSGKRDMNIFKDSFNDTARELKLFRFNFGPKIELKLKKNSNMMEGIHVDDIDEEHLKSINFNEIEKRVFTFKAFRIPNPYFSLYSVSDESIQEISAHENKIQELNSTLETHLEIGLKGIWTQIKSMPDYFKHVKALFENEMSIEDIVKIDPDVFKQGI